MVVFRFFLFLLIYEALLQTVILFDNVYDHFIWATVMDLLLFFRLGPALCFVVAFMSYLFARALGSFIVNLEKDIESKRSAFFLSINALCASVAVRKLRERFSAINNTYAEAFNFASGILSLAGLGATLFGSSGNSFFYLYRAWTCFAGFWPVVRNGISSLCGDDLKRSVSDSRVGQFFRDIKPYAGWAIAAAIAGKFYYGSGSVQPRGRKMDIRKKKNQERSDNVEHFDPVDPRDVKCDPVVTIPNSPPFINSNVVHKSLVQIQGNYTATAFRAGNYIVTAVHCLSAYNKTFGAWLYDPEEKCFLWAPLAARFKNQHSRIHGDGIAILHLPQSNYLLSRNSCSVAAPCDGQLYCATFLADNNRITPNWAISTGNGVYRTSTGNITLWSSVEKGSSGGPVLHSKGYVVGVVYAENSQHNIAFGITKEVVDFLARTGVVAQSTSEPIPYLGDCIRGFLPTGRQEALSEVLDLPLPMNTDGQIRHHYSRRMSYSSTSGISDSESEELGKDKAKKKERQRKKEGTLPSDKEFFSSHHQEELCKADDKKRKPKSRNRNKQETARFKNKKKEDLEKKDQRESIQVAAVVHVAPDAQPTIPAPLP